MNKLRHIIAISVAITTSAVMPQSGMAQSPSNPRDLIGSINIEEQDDHKVDPYPLSQNATLEFFQGYNAKLQQIASSGSGSIPDLSDGILNYLSALFLHCAVNYGTCPHILKSVLEIDVINSKNSGTITCPNMKRLWNAWVRNNLEERHKYLVKTSFIQISSEFKEKERPKYLKCDQTITGILKDSGSAAQFYKQRYAADSEYLTFAPKIVALITQVIEKDKIRNLFVQYGAQSPDQAVSAPKGKGGGSGGTAKKQRR